MHLTPTASMFSPRPRWRFVLAALVALPLLAGASSAARPHPPRAHIALSRLAQHPALRDPATAAALLLDAARDDDAPAVESLLRLGVSPDGRNGSGRTALLVAAYYGNRAVVNALLAHGAAVDAADSVGSTALMTSSFRGDPAVVTALLARGALVDRANRAGQTALMFASLFARPEARRVLLAHGADPRRADCLGNTAESLARYAALGGDVAAFAHRAADEVNGLR